MPVSNSAQKRTAKLYVLSKNITPPKDGASEPEKEKYKNNLRSLKERKWNLNLYWLIAVLFIVAILLSLMRAFLEKGLTSDAVSWLFQLPPKPSNPGDFSAILAPLVAISVAIERSLETLFDWFEQSTRAVADVLSVPKDALDWIGREYQNAYEAAKKAAEEVGVDAKGDTLEGLKTAEARLAKAEERLRSWVNAPEYLAWKRALCIWVGLLVGLLVAVLADLGIFRLIGIPMPRLLDMLITGLVMGAGSGPMHSIIGILQGGKDAVNNLAELAKAKSIKDSVEALQNR